MGNIWCYKNKVLCANVTPFKASKWDDNSVDINADNSEDKTFVYKGFVLAIID